MKKKLEFMADRIEAVLSLHKVPARVTGGTVTPRWIRFQVLPAIGAKISKIKNLSEELAAALDAPNCRVSRRGAAVAVEVPRDDPQPVRLLPLYDQLTENNEERRIETRDSPSSPIPPTTAILGLAEDGAPLLIRLPSPDVAHILVAGTTGSGKTVLLQAMILSLAMSNSPPSNGRGERELSLMLIDPKGHAFGLFEGLPHLARPVIREAEEASEALSSLVYLMKKRGSGNGNSSRAKGQPHVVVVIDELAELVSGNLRHVVKALKTLTHAGHELGIHIVAATDKAEVFAGFQHNDDTLLTNIIEECNFPVRLVGRMDADGARAVTGWSGIGAERLMGRGDFLAVAEGRVIRFQVAHVSPDEIQKVVIRLARDEIMLAGAFTPAAPRFSLPWPVNRLAEQYAGRV